ncbi:hypothetical protein, partial [Vibrio parahaemolyticus]
IVLFPGAYESKTFIPRPRTTWHLENFFSDTFKATILKLSLPSNRIIYRRAVFYARFLKHFTKSMKSTIVRDSAVIAV